MLIECLSHTWSIAVNCLNVSIAPAAGDAHVLKSASTAHACNGVERTNWCQLRHKTEMQPRMDIGSGQTRNGNATENGYWKWSDNNKGIAAIDIICDCSELARILFYFKMQLHMFMTP